MAITDYLPFRQVKNDSNNIIAKSLDGEEIRSVTKAMKVASLALGFQWNTYFFSKRAIKAVGITAATKRK